MNLNLGPLVSVNNVFLQQWVNPVSIAEQFNFFCICEPDHVDPGHTPRLIGNPLNPFGIQPFSLFERRAVEC